MIIIRVLSLVVLCNNHSFNFLPPPPPNPQTLEYSWLSLLDRPRFICNPSLPKSVSSIQLFGSTKVTPLVFAMQSYLSFNAPIRRHGTSLRLSTPFRTNFDLGNLVFAFCTRAYTSPITYYGFAALLKSRAYTSPITYYGFAALKSSFVPT
ncbi:hypothetical protein L798_12170 [Zootermopsis nevadensis]|uniref:Uncharacterized protein n=1 Tax=Zootermopsis nevadensis TaxID=136037 RepID=A0A067RIE2_ZOONE|nr:hypothetical protein L798_12170 [Zootermopsis nevadensis]